MAKLMNTGGSPVNEGEAKAINFLEKNLPDNYVIYPNIELSARPKEQLFEFDAIVVAPHAVYAVEVKDWNGSIVGNDYDWVLNAKESRKNPVSGIRHKAKVLKGKLDFNDRNNHKLADVWVEGIVAIVNPQTTLSLSGDYSTSVFHLAKVVDFIKNPARLHSGKQVKADSILPLISVIQSILGGSDVKGRDGTKNLKFDHYKVVEKLDAESDLVTEYVAENIAVKNLKSSKVRLRVFANSPYTPKDQLVAQENFITREYEALDKIGYHPNLLPANNLFPLDGDKLVEVTEWPDGRSLQAAFVTGANFNFEQKIEIVRGLLNGLKAAHAKEVYHRAINPSNVFLREPDFVPQLMNFDRARLNKPLQSGQNNNTVWAAEGFIEKAKNDGTLIYIAPELSRLDYKAYSNSDLFSIGVVFLDLLLFGIAKLNGRAEVDDFAKEELKISELISDDLPANVDGNRLDDFVSKLVQADHYERYQTASEALQALEEIFVKPVKEVLVPQEFKPAIPEIYSVGDWIDGKFQVIDMLGSGGFSHVYKVHEPITDMEYALKVINIKKTETDLEHLRKEFKPLYSLNHPSIIRVFGAGQVQQTQFYLQTELVEGNTLEKHIDQNSPSNTTGYIGNHVKSTVKKDFEQLDTAQIVKLGNELLKALEYMHENGYLHRDIKPSNLMLSKRGSIKIIDFNIAANESTANYTQIGTMGYIAPDILYYNWDASCDLYAVGVVLYQLVTQHHPLNQNSIVPGRTTTAPADPRQFLSSLSPQLANFLQKACMSDRRERFTSAKEMYEALEQAMISSSAKNTPPPTYTNSSPVRATPTYRQPTTSSSTSSAPLYRMSLPQTYYKQGFFNVPVDFDRYVLSTEGYTTITLITASGRQTTVQAKINRSANTNGTPRIMGGSQVRDWFQDNFRVGDVVEVYFTSPQTIRLAVPQH